MAFQSIRLQYYKFKEEDFQDYLSMVSNLEVMRNITGRALTGKEARSKFDQVLQINRQHQKLGVYKVFLRESQTFIGLAKIVADKNASNKILTNLNFRIKEKGLYEGLPAYYFHYPLNANKK
jgi:hypothetical protein